MGKARQALEIMSVPLQWFVLAFPLDLLLRLPLILCVYWFFFFSLCKLHTDPVSRSFHMCWTRLLSQMSHLNPFYTQTQTERHTHTLSSHTSSLISTSFCVCVLCTAYLSCHFAPCKSVANSLRANYKEKRRRNKLQREIWWSCGSLLKNRGGVNVSGQRVDGLVSEHQPGNYFNFNLVDGLFLQRAVILPQQRNDWGHRNVSMFSIGGRHLRIVLHQLKWMLTLCDD